MAHDNKAITTSQLFRVPLVMPQKIRLWFTLLERQLAAAGITDDVTKSTVLLECLEPEYLERIENTVLNPPTTGLYDKLKDEFTRILAEIDRDRVTKLVESEVMGDRKPSQFYHDLKIKLASPFASDQFILTLWRNRLPDHISEVLTAVDDTNVGKLMQIADKVEEVFSRNSQRASSITAVTDPPVQNAVLSNPVAAAINGLSDRLLQIQMQIEALKNDKYRRPRRHRSRSQKSQRQDGLCFYHAEYRERAKKCISPCTWKSENETSRQ